jgi:hypothetical protein
MISYKVLIPYKFVNMEAGTTLLCHKLVKNVVEFVVIF